LTAL
jgi:hypothetical protein